jgi:hypothetical protein
MNFCTKCGAPVEGAFCNKCGTKVSSSDVAGPEIPKSAPAVSQVSSSSQPITVPKKRKTLFWILGGCLGLIIIGVIIIVSLGIWVVNKAGLDFEQIKRDPQLATAKIIMANADPNVEVLSVDEKSGIIRVRDKKTGKTMTVNLSDAKKGKIVFQDEQNKTLEIQTQSEGAEPTAEIRSSEGVISMGKGQLPAWLPSYPGAESAGTFGFSAENSNTGSCAFKTGDSPDKASAFYENALKNAGFKIQKTTTQIPDQGSMIILAATDSGTKRTANVTISSTNEGTAINLVFEEKK